MTTEVENLQAKIIHLEELQDAMEDSRRTRLEDSVDIIKVTLTTLQETVNMIAVKQLEIIKREVSLQNEIDFKVNIAEEKIDKNEERIDKLNNSFQAQLTHYPMYPDMKLFASELLIEATKQRQKEIAACKEEVFKRFRLWLSIFLLGGTAIITLYQFIEYVNKPENANVVKVEKG